MVEQAAATTTIVAGGKLRGAQPTADLQQQQPQTEITMCLGGRATLVAP